MSLADLTDDKVFIFIAENILKHNKIREYRPRPYPLLIYTDDEFRQRYRLTKPVVADIIEMISVQISASTRRNHAVTPKDKVLSTLYFYASGSFCRVVADSHGLHPSTITKIVLEVSRAIASLGAQFIRMPTNEEQINNIKKKFYKIAKFPRCVGAIDCTHIKIMSPGGDNAEIFRNRKNVFSFNVQAICDTDLKIRSIVCRWPGSTHDAHIFRNSKICEKFENGDFLNSVLVGDSGYEIKPYLITPVNNPSTNAESLFNESHIRTRNVIERCFGVLKRRFPILALGIRQNIKNVEAIAVACAVLHNIAIDAKEEVPHDDIGIEAQITEQMIITACPDERRTTALRQPFITYFNNL